MSAGEPSIPGLFLFIERGDAEVLEFIKEVLGWVFSTLAERFSYFPRCPVCGESGGAVGSYTMPFYIDQPEVEKPLVFEVTIPDGICLNCGHVFLDKRRLKSAMRFWLDVEKAVSRLNRAGGTVLVASGEKEAVRP